MRAVRILLIAGDVAEVRRQIDDEWRVSGIGLPCDLVDKNLGTLIVGAPPLDEPCIDVHDPVLRDALSLVQSALDMSVCACG
jgi:hypothetical protein